MAVSFGSIKNLFNSAASKIRTAFSPQTNVFRAEIGGNLPPSLKAAAESKAGIGHDRLSPGPRSTIPNFTHPTLGAITATTDNRFIDSRTGQDITQSVQSNQTLAPKSALEGTFARREQEIGGSSQINSNRVQSQQQEREARARFEEFVPRDKFGRKLFTKEGKPIALPGLTGFEGAANNITFDPAQSGVPGISGGGTSAFTGLLGAVSGLNTPAQQGSGDRDKEAIQTRVDKILEGQDLSLRTPFQAAPVNPRQEPVSAPTLPDTFAVGDLASSRATRSVLTSPQAQVPNDLVQEFNRIQQSFETLRAQQAPTPPVPIESTPEQDAYLDLFPQEEKVNVASIMDEVRQSLGIPQVTAQRLEVMKDLQAMNGAYEEVYDDIKSNPDLPKGLAQRRLSKIAEEHKKSGQQLLDQLELLNIQIDDLNQMFNQQFDIVQAQLSQEERERDNARDSLRIMIDSGAIAGLSEGELKQWAQRTGVNTSALRKVRNKALEPQVKVVTREDSAGNLVGVDQNTGRIIWRQPGFGKAGGGGGKPLTRSEVDSFGLPRTLIGADSTRVVSDLNSSTAPNWFFSQTKEGRDAAPNFTTVEGRNVRIDESGNFVNPSSIWNTFRNTILFENGVEANPFK